MLIVSGGVAVLGAQTGGPSADEIARTIAVAQKVGTTEPLTDTARRYSFGLRLLDRQGPVITSIQGPLNRIFTDARTAVARRSTYTAASVSDAAREAAITTIAIPNNTYQFWDSRGPVRVSEVLFKVFRSGSKDPQVIHPSNGCQFSPLEYKKPSGEDVQVAARFVQIPAGPLLVPRRRFEVVVVHDQGDGPEPFNPKNYDWSSNVRHVRESLSGRSAGRARIARAPFSTIGRWIKSGCFTIRSII
jgi:hypothetical protein